MIDDNTDMDRKALTIADLHSMKRSGEKIACLTAYDASFAAVLDQAGIDVVLVGDTLGMVVQGRTTTLPVTVDSMVYHSQCVARGITRALVVTDMPFMSYATTESALNNAARIVQEGQAHIVKLEGAHCEIIETLSQQGILVCAHLGLLPQSVYRLGGYRVQGKEASAAERILQQALDVEQAGAVLLVLECVPASLAARITQRLSIPVIGIGAGVDCDGQVLVLYDIINLHSGRKPRFFKDFLQGAGSIQEAVRRYRSAVKDATYPGSSHSY